MYSDTFCMHLLYVVDAYIHVYCMQTNKKLPLGIITGPALHALHVVVGNDDDDTTSGGWIDVASHLLKQLQGLINRWIGNDMNDRSGWSLEQVCLHGDTRS